MNLQLTILKSEMVLEFQNIIKFGSKYLDARNGLVFYSIINLSK